MKDCQNTKQTQETEELLNSVVSDDDTQVSGEVVICPRCMQSDYVHPVRTGEKTGVAAGALYKCIKCGIEFEI